MKNRKIWMKMNKFIFIFAKKLDDFYWNFEIWAVQKYVHLVDLVESFPTRIWLQKPASIQPRTSLSKFGGKFNPFFIRHLAGKRTERRLRGALERGPRLGGCRDQVGRSVGQCQKIQIAKNRPRYSRERSRLNFPPRATSGQISQVSFFALPAQEHNFVASKRTQSSAKWYAVRYEVEDGRRERRRWWWRWRGCLYSLKCFIGF